MRRPALVALAMVGVMTGCVPNARDQAVQRCIERSGGGQPPSRVAECWASNGVALAASPIPGRRTRPTL